MAAVCLKLFYISAEKNRKKNTNIFDISWKHYQFPTVFISEYQQDFSLM